SVAKGDTVAKGDRLLSIEAMKMETAVYADHAGAVSEVLVKAGVQVDTKDLLLVIGAAAAGDPEDEAEDDREDAPAGTGAREAEGAGAGGDEPPPDGAEDG